MKYLNYDSKTMTNQLLWEAVLTPIEEKMPENLKKFLNECTVEFSNRTEIKLIPVMDCK